MFRHARSCTALSNTLKHRVVRAHAVNCFKSANSATGPTESKPRSITSAERRGTTATTNAAALSPAIMSQTAVALGHATVSPARPAAEPVPTVPTPHLLKA